MEPSSPPHDSDAPLPLTTTYLEPDRIEYEQPLYTEINIPLPKLPAPPKSIPQPSASTSPSTSTSATSSPPTAATPSKHSRTRARSLSSFSFRSRPTSSPSPSPPSSTSPRHSADDSWPRIRPSLLRSRETAAAMDLNHANKRGRSGTVDALAVVPAVLVLSAELFTPGTGRRGEGMVGGMR